MSDTSNLPTPEIRKGRKKFISGVSLVWLVPVAAIAGALGLAWQTYANRDIPVEIEFEAATGIEVGKTEIRFREMKVGSVTDMRFSDNLEHVIVEAAINRDMEHFLDQDTRFWLVTARVGPGGVSGLSTLLSGAYISADWDAKKSAPSRHFVAEAKAPIVPPGADGTAILINSPNSGSISVGAPILHKGIAMGKVAEVRYSPEGDSVLISAFIEAPNDKLITTASRFWNVSGIGFELGENGVELKVDSLASLLQGGIAFDTAMSGGEPIDEDTVFDLYPSQEKARDSVLGDTLAATVELVSSFEGTVRGLREGADVMFRGLKIGQVLRISAQTERAPEGNTEIRMQVVYTVQPSRLGLDNVRTSADTLELLSQMVEGGGLRARLAVSSIFSGGLHVELYEDPDAAPAVLQDDAKPYPVMPSTPTPPDTLAVAAQNVMDRIAALPVEDLMQRAIAALDNVNSLITDPDTRQIPADIRSVLGNVSEVTASESLRALPDDLKKTIDSVNATLERFEQGNAVQKLVEVLEEIKQAAGNISTASEELPDLLSDIDTLVNKVNDLPLDTVIASTDEVLKSANTVLQDIETEALPAALNSALAQAEETLAELKTTAGSVNATLQQFDDKEGVQNIIDMLTEVRAAATYISDASTDVPKLVEDIDALVLKASDLPLEDVVASADDVLKSANTLLQDVEAEALPATLTSALKQAEETLAELKTTASSVNATLQQFDEKQGIQNILDMLEDVRTAAANISTASSDLPKLIEDIDALVLKANDLPLENVVASADEVLQSANGFLQNEDLQDVPGALASALDQAGLALDELREGGAVANLNRTLDSASTAADNIAMAVKDLPELAKQLEQLADTAEATIGAYGPGSPVNREVQAAIGDLRATVRSLNQLVQAIRRKPNSLLVGR